MLTTVWIHRCGACDILVRFPTREEAYNFCVVILKADDGEVNSWDCKSFTGPGSCFFAGHSMYLQPSIHDGEFHHAGWSVPGSDFAGPWNDRGTVLVSALEAIQLGNMGEPEGFIPWESESLVWTKETRTAKELDAELEAYMEEGHQLELENERARIHRSISAMSLESVSAT